MKKRFMGLILLFCMLSPTLNIAYAETDTEQSKTVTFSDVRQSDWFYTYVSELSKNSVVSGYPDGTFRPDDRVTCGEALKLIILAAGYGEQPASGRHWATGYLNFASVRRFVDAATVTDLDAPISRLMIAQIAAKALGLPLTDTRSPFADVSDMYVTALFKKGVILGTYNEDGRLIYYPVSKLKRSEMSAIIWRIKNPGSAPAGDINDDTKDSPEDTKNNPGTETGKIVFGNYTLDILKDVPVNEYDPSAFYVSNGKMQYRSNTITTYSGIDVSSYQGSVDWKKVKASGIDFAIIRVGYRGYETGRICLDDYFESNAREAVAAGLKIGVYFFSQATTADEARQEADFVLSYISGLDIAYPVVFDWEPINASTARTNNVSTDDLCSAANAFCKRVEDSGFKPMVYFNKSVGYLRYDLSKIKAYDFWFAQYSDKPSFYYNFHMWQYTSSGKVNGISGYVDMNICFKKY